MTREQRNERIKVLTTELSSLLAEENPLPSVKCLTQADLPGWVAQGLRDAILRKIAAETPIKH
jgi:hypothetical protein